MLADDSELMELLLGAMFSPEGERVDGGNAQPGAFILFYFILFYCYYKKMRTPLYCPLSLWPSLSLSDRPHSF
jgi:hypothetical protein